MPPGRYRLRTIAQEIGQLTEKSSSAINFNQWPADVLADYVVNNHHHYIEQVTPTITNLLSKICNVHGDRHPELLEIRDIFKKTSGELAAHMKKEELILFPFIKKLVNAHANSTNADSKLFDSVTSPIHQLNEEHLDEGEQLERMAALSNNYTPPEDACITYQTTFRLLKEYESDMHLHIHLEKNILFLKAQELEASLKQKTDKGLNLISGF